MIVYFKFGETVKEFNALQLFSNIKSESIVSTTLRGFSAEKPKYARRIWQILIDTRDILTDTDIEFLQSFFLASPRWISLDNSSWRAVQIAPGDFPLENLENCKFLPSVKFTLASASADISKLTGEVLIG